MFNATYIDIGVDLEIVFRSILDSYMTEASLNQVRFYSIVDKDMSLICIIAL